MPAEEVNDIQSEAEKVSEESKVHDPDRHTFRYPTDRVANINKKISISIKFPDGMKIVKTGISFTELKNSLAFGSHKGAEVSVIYHTFIETCKMCGVSTLEYFKELFKAASKREQTKVLLSVCRA